jgi:hypothetical protein
MPEYLCLRGTLEPGWSYRLIAHVPLHLNAETKLQMISATPEMGFAVAFVHTRSYVTMIRQGPQNQLLPRHGLP